jgi:hypothetical protein
MATTTTRDASGVWDRRRLLLTLAGVLSAAVLLVAGLVYAVVWGIGSATAGSSGGDDRPESAPLRVDGDTAEQRRDAIAAAPMTAVAASAARSGTPAPVAGPTITVPAATTVGPADVPTGFPPTAQGAVGQLAAIDTTVLTSMSIAHTGAVHQAWALPGAPGVEEWVMTGNVQAFLAASGSPTLDDISVVTAAPVAGQIKGTDGERWSVVCVLLDVRATITASARIGYGRCERMQWHGDEQGGRWMIAPGAQPAKAPSTWPGSQAAADAGWATWVEAEQS